MVSWVASEEQGLRFDWMMDMELGLLSDCIVRHEILLLPCSCLISAQISL